MDTLTATNGSRFIALFGGAQLDSVGQTTYSDDVFYIFNLQTRTWTDRSDLGGPGMRIFTLGVADGSKFYVHAGLSPEFQTLNDLWVFDINTLTWTEITPSSDVRPPAVAKPVGDILINRGLRSFVVTSGLEVSFTEQGDIQFGFTGATFGFNFNSNQWVDLSPRVSYLPLRTFSAASASKNRNRLIMYGGDGEPGGVTGCGEPNFANPQGDLWEYRDTSNVWVEDRVVATQHPPKLKRHEVIQVGRYFFVMGGFDFQCDNGVGPGQIFNYNVHVLV